MDRPNILFLMCDQFRFDCIAALGNSEVQTPNIDRLVRRGVSFTNAYSTNPVCVAARYTIRTGCEPHTTGSYCNEPPRPMDGLPAAMAERCGDYLPAAMKKLGYFTFGAGKEHTMPQFDEDLGYDVRFITEELWANMEEERRDDYAAFLHKNHPQFNFIEQLHGERTNMYYMPQMSPLPAELTVEAYVADRAVEQISAAGEKPYFGFVSFIGPHPPCAPPVPFNRMYDPDKMPDPVVGDIEVDHMDEQIPWMNHLIWADELNGFLARNLRSRYYGEITYIDGCIGRILDAVEARPDADNTLICFFADHGDHLGDHHAWQKESYFEAACRVPFLVSWPRRWAGGTESRQLACLTDLFGMATGAAGAPQLRQGHDVLGVLDGEADERRELLACYGRPGSPQFKLMLREGDLKYIWLANGGRRQLFNVAEDPGELTLLNDALPEKLAALHAKAEALCGRPGLLAALEDGRLKALPFTPRPLARIHQFNAALGVEDFTL